MSAPALSAPDRADAATVFLFDAAPAADDPGDPEPVWILSAIGLA